MAFCAERKNSGVEVQDDGAVPLPPRPAGASRLLGGSGLAVIALGVAMFFGASAGATIPQLRPAAGPVAEPDTQAAERPDGKGTPDDEDRSGRPGGVDRDGGEGGGAGGPGTGSSDGGSGDGGSGDGASSGAGNPGDESGLVIDEVMFPTRILAPTVSPALLIGHRGGSVLWPESTLPNFRDVIAAGAQAVEFDVRFTRDGVPVILHNKAVNATTNCKGFVAEMTLATLRDCEVGTTYARNPLAGERVPTLDEALAVIAPSSAKAYLHVKVASPSQAATLVRTVARHGMNTSAGPSGRAVFMADSKVYLANLRAAGAKRLGYVFHSPRGWSADYPVLVARGTPVTKALVRSAQKAGKFVIAVENWPVSAAQVGHLGLDGLIADDLDVARLVLDGLPGEVPGDAA